MRLGKEIERLRQRVHKLSIEKDPPTLRMVIVKEGEAQKELSDWDQLLFQQKCFSNDKKLL